MPVKKVVKKVAKKVAAKKTVKSKSVPKKADKKKASKKSFVPDEKWVKEESRDEKISPERLKEVHRLVDEILLNNATGMLLVAVKGETHTKGIAVVNDLSDHEILRALEQSQIDVVELAQHALFHKAN